MTTLPVSNARRPRRARWWWHRADWLWAGLRAGVLEDHDPGAAPATRPVSLHPIGRLFFPGGRLVLADPFWLDADIRPMAQTLADAPYDVTVATVEIEPGHLRTAAAILTLGDRPVAAWEMAGFVGADGGGLGWDGFLGYGVDSGTGCFAGLEAARRVGPVIAADDGRLEDRLSRTLCVPDPPPGAVVEVVGGWPIAAFASGWGDGCYPTWLGRDDDGVVAVVVTDFMVVTDPYQSARERRGRWFRPRRP